MRWIAIVGLAILAACALFLVADVRARRKHEADLAAWRYKLCRAAVEQETEYLQKEYPHIGRQPDVVAYYKQLERQEETKQSLYCPVGDTGLTAAGEKSSPGASQ